MGIQQLLLTSLPTLVLEVTNVTGFNSGFASSGEVNSDTGPSLNVLYSSGSWDASWTHVSTSTGLTPDISRPMSATPTWSAVVTDGSENPAISTWQVEVVDLVTGAKARANVTVTLTWVNLN